MSEISEAFTEAIEAAAGVERRGDWGLGLHRPPVNPRDGDIRAFRAKLQTFLREMPEDVTVRDMLEELI